MFSKLLKEIEDLSITYKYKPLNNELKEKYHKLYKDNLNGFETKRNLNINNIPIAKKYERIVIGDYGAYVEFLPEDLLVELKVTKGQEWRLDKEFIKKRNLNLKYEWYEYQGYKVYLQTNTVTYADYKPGYYYISVLYFDIINKEDNMFMKNEYVWLSNMCLFPKPIIINNEKIKSSEHYYHSRKTTDPVLRKQILDMDNPYEVKKFCKSIKIRDDWEDVKIPVMKEASNIKYSITYFRLKLIACKEPIIEENKHYDIFWGTCNGKGEDHLGKILTEIRERIILEEDFKIRIRYGDLYKSDMEYKCFTANSSLNKYGELIMGKGNALTVKELYPNLPKVFGNKIEDQSIYGCKLDVDTNIIAFQTKTDWRKNSTKEIIDKSISKLKDFAINVFPSPIGLPFPGINNGKLNENMIISSLLELKPANIYIWKNEPTSFFTGIGSRRTPRHIGYVLKEFTFYMTSRGYKVRSGGAPEADKYCESGVVNTFVKKDKDFKEIYIPWKGFNGSDSTLYTKEDPEEVINIARENHPIYDYLKPQVKKLMNRNVYQVLGFNLDKPSEFVICYTPDGCKSHNTRTDKTGGTGLAISVASKNNIPIINLGNEEDLKWILSLLNIERKILDLGNEIILFKETFNKDITESFNLWLDDKLNLRDEYDFLNKYIPLHLKNTFIFFIGNNKVEYYTKESHG